jgi:hypothetical protein
MKKLACRLGRHEWTTRVERGESYKVCSSCGKFAAGPKQSGLPGRRTLALVEVTLGKPLRTDLRGGRRAWTVVRLTALGRPSSPAGFGSKERSRAMPQASLAAKRQRGASPSVRQPLGSRIWLPAEQRQ